MAACLVTLGSDVANFDGVKPYLFTSTSGHLEPVGSRHDIGAASSMIKVKRTRDVQT